MNIKQLITAALIASAAFATQAAPQKPVSAAQTAQHSAVWIDVRSEQEFSEGHLHNAVNIPVDQIVRRIYEARPTKTRRSTSTAAADGVPKPPFKS